ncbi:hypothetical protein GGF37_005268 [Kickxella alabastrina]|nr:hypothetical protein GGF37_005268 [Kickxella alabastrina]
MRQQETHHRQSSGSNSSYSSQETVGDQDKAVNAFNATTKEEHRGNPPDLCRWICGTNPKTDILYRRHILSTTTPITSPLFRLHRPTKVTELLDKYTEFIDRPISSFMGEHSSLDTFKPYVLGDAHSLPRSPQSVLVNDRATHYLPPLVAEEYAGHVSRLSYLVRSLHAIEVADPVFLSDPRTHLLLDLVMDLETKFTLPRVDLLRAHAQNIQEMEKQKQQQQPPSHHIHRPEALDRAESDYDIGDALSWVWNAQTSSGPQSEISSEFDHVGQTTLHHKDSDSDGLRSGCTDVISSEVIFSSAQSYDTDDSDEILGFRLQVANALSTNGFSSIVAEKTAVPLQLRHVADTSASNRVSIDSSGFNKMGVRQFSTPPARYLRDIESVTEMTLRFDPKLHPVAGPRSMQVSLPHSGSLSSREVSVAEKQQQSILSSKASTGTRKLRRKSKLVPKQLLSLASDK